MVYQESDSETEVELVDAAGGDETDSDEGVYYTDEDGSEGQHEDGEQHSDDL